MGIERHREPARILVRMGWVYTVTIGLMILISGEAVYHYVYTDMERMTEETILLKLDATVRLLNNMFDDVDRAMQTIVSANGTVLKTTDASDSPLYHIVSAYQEIKFGDRNTTSAVEELAVINNILKNVFSDEMGIKKADYRIRIYLDDRYAVTRFMSYGKEVKQSGIFKAAMTKENPVYEVLNMTDGNKKFFHVYNHKDYDAGLYEGMLLNCNVVENDWKVSKECLGYIVCEFRKGMVEEILVGKDTQHISSYILDENGEVWVSYTGYKEISRPELLKIVKDGLEHIRVGEEDYLVKQSSLTNGMKIIMVMPQSTIRKQVMGNLSILFMVFLILLTVYILVLLYMNHHLIRPIVNLSKHMERGGIEELEEDRSANSSREMMVLYQSFNQFIRQSRQYIDNIYRIEKEKREMEYSVLQAQINPHFLYNTLDSIGCLAMLSGQDEVADLLQSLAKIMRYSIHDMYSLVPLQKEIDIVREFIKIQYNCFRGRLEVFYDIEDDLKDVRVPKLIVQPLVENAISHGMNMESEKGILEIGGMTRNGFVFITVWDNGKELDRNKVERYLAGEIKSDTKGGGLGIYNIAQRLHSQYGEQSELFFEQDENGCTEAIIKIPSTIQ